MSLAIPVTIDVYQFNAPTFFTQSNEIYSYPDLWICTQESYGCDEYGYREKCTKSINDTEGGPTTARYRPGDKDELNIYFTAKLTEVTEPTFSQDKLLNFSY